MSTRLILAFSAIPLLLLSCTSSHINSKRINNDAFPPEFKCSECILLVLKRTGGVNPKGINNYLEKSFRKNYTGKFEMVTPEEADNNEKYKDKNIYRFIVSDQVRTGGDKVVTKTTSNGIVTGNSIQYNYTYTMDFRIYDRLKDKGYASLGFASNVPTKSIKRISVLLTQ